MIRLERVYDPLHGFDTEFIYLQLGNQVVRFNADMSEIEMAQAIEMLTNKFTGSQDRHHQILLDYSNLLLEKSK